MVHGADGWISEGMIEKRDKQFGISSDELRERMNIYGYQVPKVEVQNRLMRLEGNGRVRGLISQRS